MFDIYPIELNLIGGDLTEVLSWKDAKTVSGLYLDLLTRSRCFLLLWLITMIHTLIILLIIPYYIIHGV